jgi:antitoxin (DNA-binding transcriptional repressor) of toxin-antitoxin stability system
MQNIQKSEFKTRALELFRLVEKGESFVVTDRGRPVALVSPILPVMQELDSLQGSVTMYERPLDPVGLEDWEGLR